MVRHVLIVPACARFHHWPPKVGSKVSDLYHCKASLLPGLITVMLNITGLPAISCSWFFSFEAPGQNRIRRNLNALRRHVALVYAVRRRRCPAWTPASFSMPVLKKYAYRHQGSPPVCAAKAGATVVKSASTVCRAPGARLGDAAVSQLAMPPFCVRYCLQNIKPPGRQSHSCMLWAATLP